MGEITRLNKILTKFVKKFGIDKAIYTGGYSFSYEDNTLEYKVTNRTWGDVWFEEYVEERFNHTVKNSFIMSILHEIGHSQANEEIEGAILDFCLNEKFRIDVEMLVAENEEDEETAKILSWQYYNLPDEIMATQWAVNYAETHTEELKQLALAIMPLVNNLSRTVKED